MADVFILHNYRKTMGVNARRHHVQEILGDHARDIQEFTCDICLEPKLIPSQRFRNEGRCSHPFCTKCVIEYIRVKVWDDNAGRIKCPALNCDHMLDPHACASLIGPSLFSRWCDVLCEAEVLGVDKCYCPHIDCNVVILNECGGDPRKSSCPNCKRSFCFRCKTGWHARLWCEDMGEVRDSYDRAFIGLVKRKGWRRCPSCGRFVEQNGGCQSIKCRCGIEFCYNCVQRRCRCPFPFNDCRYVVFICFVTILVPLVLIIIDIWSRW